MATWKDDIVIRAPAERVGEYLDDVRAFPDWMLSMVEVRDVIGTGEGQQFEWTYKMAGLLFRGQTIVIEHVPGRCSLHQIIGAIHSFWRYDLEPHEDGTRLIMTVDYTVPIPVLGRIAERLATRRVAREFEIALLNIKEFLEEA